jgi:hypothetical protein
MSFTPPPDTQYTILSLGAGVQSSCLALMAAKGEIGPMPDAAIFADTQAEPASVYVWLDWLEKQLPFPVLRVTRGDLTEASLRVRTSKKTGQNYVKHAIPAFISRAGHPNGIMQRACTLDFKIEVLEREMRKMAGIRRHKKGTPPTVTTWIGMSMDELQRVKAARKPWNQNRWPLLEKRMTRRDCLQWMKDAGYPEPPRSSCSYCPYHSNREWQRLKDDEPASFAQAVWYEKQLQKSMERVERIDGVPYLHPLRESLDTIDFTKPLPQMDLWQDFNNECAGMCGA